MTRRILIYTYKRNTEYPPGHKTTLGYPLWQKKNKVKYIFTKKMQILYACINPVNSYIKSMFNEKNKINYNKLFGL